MMVFSATGNSNPSIGSVPVDSEPQSWDLGLLYKMTVIFLLLFIQQLKRAIPILELSFIFQIAFKVILRLSKLCFYPG